MRTPWVLRAGALAATLVAGPGCDAMIPSPEAIQARAWAAGETARSPCAELLRLATDRHVVVQLHDLREVTLYRGNDGVAVVMAGDGGREASVASGRVATGDRTSGEYELFAAREPDGTLSLRWKTDLLLGNGQRQVLVGADGALPPIAGPADAMQTRGAFNADTVRVPVCVGWSGPSRSVYQTRMRTGDAEPCDGTAATWVWLLTPWKNVDIHDVQHFTGDRARAGRMCERRLPEERDVVVYPRAK